MSPADDLPPHLRALFAAERESYPDDDAARARVHRRLETAIAFGAVGGAAAAAGVKTGPVATSGLVTAKGKLGIALALASGIAIGETHARLSALRAVAPEAQDRSATALASSQPSTAVVPPAAVLSAPTAFAPAAPSASAADVRSAARDAAFDPVEPTRAPASSLPAEQALIDTTRSALARGRGGDALAAADEHARRFPRGRLAEERETLAIQALLLVGLRRDAETRARRFHSSYRRACMATPSTLS